VVEAAVETVQLQDTLVEVEELEVTEHLLLLQELLQLL
tara:strand:- start:347 stop:460 length:114 start_codon:yes stop_codon:yes gene_type:complete